ncbi:uncharacterized protein [Solanum lycopersicum]|uniref:uncharacterized protein n=1 Tax=Solanum lycopersicum TaxID=4081 RepID=UPI000532DA86|nr:uncharacterized protein LOC104649709 [Solanum lycopersicum]
MNAFHNFHEDMFERSFNATFIRLIPKKKGAKELQDFRPISLIGIIYKIFSKVLAERLKGVMTKLVDSQEMAFIKVRQIMDAVLVANEAMRSRQKQGKPGILCKLDIEKAYDYVYWAYLLGMLNRMGFGQKWINWMKNKKILRVIFVLFEGMSGLHINWGKSFLYPINEVITMQSVNAIPGGEIGSLPTMHLGMPLGANSKSNEIWNNVVEKCEKKLARWKRQYLSLGGRLTLINSVLDSLPTYMMSLFPIPAKIISRLDRIRKKFLWQENKDRKSYYLV